MADHLLGRRKPGARRPQPRTATPRSGRHPAGSARASGPGGDGQRQRSTAPGPAAGTGPRTEPVRAARAPQSTEAGGARRRGDPRFRIDPRFRQRRIEVKREAGRKRLRVLIAVTSVLVAVAAALGVARSPLLAVRHVRVAGTAHLTSADVVAASGLAGHHQMLDVDAGSVARRIELVPWVDVATVRREWPTTVRVMVTERVPVATVGSGAGSMAVDGTGRVLAPAGDVHVPALEPAPGVEAPGVPAPGSALDRFFAPGLAVAAAMPADLAPRVQSIVVGSAEDVRLRLQSGQDVVLGSAADTEAKLAAILTLEVRQKLGPGTLDVTVPSAPVLTPPPSIGNFSTRTGG